MTNKPVSARSSALAEVKARFVRMAAAAARAAHGTLDPGQALLDVDTLLVEASTIMSKAGIPFPERADEVTLEGNQPTCIPHVYQGGKW